MSNKVSKNSGPSVSGERRSARLSRAPWAFGVGASWLALAAVAQANPVGGTIDLFNPEKFEKNGYFEQRTFYREETGLSKVENTLQVEFSRDYRGFGPFSSVSLNGTLRGRYEAVYDLNDEYGDDAGGSIMLESVGGSGYTPHGASDITGGTLDVPLPGNTFGFDVAANPNSGLEVLGQRLHAAEGGVTFGVPVRPCDIDPRGCIDGYMDATEDELRFPDFNGRADFLREFYFDAAISTGATSELGFRLGRQQVVWGRTDLFRVLDVINPVDYSRQNIYDELEDIRIPMWMLYTEYRAGAMAGFDDLNFAVVWNFDKFRPSNLGQAGTPYQILDAGSFFRGMSACWEYGCSVSNFAGGNTSTDFGPGVIGIRQANLPEWTIGNSQWGAKLEGVFKGVGFSLNYLDYISQLPSLHGGIPATNSFTGQTDTVWPYLIAFDIEFPRIKLYGASADFYADAIKSVFRIEAAYTTGEEFANTLRPDLYSDSDVVRYVFGWDRDIFIRALNNKKAFLLSTQIFGQHLLDHELEATAGSAAGLPSFTEAGIPDWKNNWIATLLFKGWWKQNRLSPQLLAAYDIQAEAAAIAPSVDWIINDRFRLIVGANFKVGKGAQEFDDCRSCNPFPPYTATGLHADPTQPGSVGLGGLEPLGRFRSGPLGMAQEETELQMTLRYRF